MEKSTSLEMSKKLKEAGFNLDSLRIFIPSSGNYYLKRVENRGFDSIYFTDSVIRSYTMGELHAALPILISSDDFYTFNLCTSVVGYYKKFNERLVEFMDTKNICDAYANLILWLKDNHFPAVEHLFSK